MGFREDFGEDLENLKNASIFKMFNLRKNFSRVSPVLWLFVIGILMIIVGLTFSFLSFLIWSGILIVVIFIVYLLIWNGIGR